MKYYFAPLEGITGYVYRNAHHKFFPGTDRYYTPIVAPNYTKHFKTKEKRDVAPENNAGVPLVPQVLSNKADETLWAVEELAQLGYEEINLNLGCPMPTVARMNWTPIWTASSRGSRGDRRIPRRSGSRSRRGWALTARRRRKSWSVSTTAIRSTS